MSLTNPDKVVTKQDLADFYEEIKPYLGSYPVAIANKFSKSDIYSTTEKIVGQWTDGKPLYQKTISIGALPNNSTKQVSTDLTNASVKQFWGYAYSSSNQRTIQLSSVRPDGADKQVSVDIRNSGATIQVYSVSDVSAYTESYVTLQYTKTTDTAISIGEATEYSTTEKVVGTWIDGKTLFQKTVHTTMPDTVSTFKAIDIGVDVDFIQMTSGVMIGSADGTIATVFLNAVTSTGANPTIVTVNMNTNKLSLFTSVSGYTSKDVYITIQYTKT